MKTVSPKQLLIINLLFSKATASTPPLAIDVFPTPSNVGTPTNASECTTCIQGGWVWCSKLWNYESAGAYTESAVTTNEAGKCCFAANTYSASTNDNTIANSTKCPAAFTNASGSTIVENTGSFWCSNSMEKELALTTCRQNVTICEVGVIP